MDEKILSNQIRLMFKKSGYRYFSFPIGVKASIDDLMMSNRIRLKIVGIIEYKVEYIRSPDKKNDRLSNLRPNQQYLLNNPSRWDDRLIFIILLRHPDTLKCIKETYHYDPIEIDDEFLIMVTFGKAILQFFITDRLYFRDAILTSKKTIRLYRKGKIHFCKNLEDVPIILKKHRKLINRIFRFLIRKKSL